MNNISNEIKKLILDFEENGFSSNTKLEDSLSFKKDIQKESYKITAFCIFTDINNPRTYATTHTLLDLYIGSKKINNFVIFRHIIVCPLELQTLSMFIIDFFIFMEKSGFEIKTVGQENNYYINIKCKKLENSIMLDLYFFDNSIEYYLHQGSYSFNFRYSLDEISKKEAY
jgi:hypothetical protein